MHNKTLLPSLILAATCFVGGGVAEIDNQTMRFPQFENKQVKVWKSIVQPNRPLPLHRHEHPRVIIALTGGTMKIIEDDGHVETHVWETGKAYWLPANRPGSQHIDVNAGDRQIEVMVVELLNEI